MREVPYVVRRLARSPSTWLLAALTLALAIGGSGALLSLFDAFMLRQLAIPRPEKLVAVYPGIGEAVFGVPMRTLVELRTRQQVVTDLCGHARGSLQVEVNSVASSRQNEGMTGNCYRMLGVVPYIGRLFDERDAPDFGDPAAVAVISHRFWTQAFGSDPGIVGRTVRANGVPLTIVGVTPSSFDGIDVDRAPDLTVPLTLMMRLITGASGNARALHTIGRLRPDTTLADARAQLRLLWPEVWAATNVTPPGARPSPAAAAENLQVESIARGLSEQRIVYGSALSRLLALSGLLLLLACLNVGGVMLARTAAREQEFAVRTALGATRSHLGRLLTGEGVMLAVLASLLAVPIAWWVSVTLAATVWIRLTPTTIDAAPAPWVVGVIGVVGLAMGLSVSVPAVIFVFRRRWQITSSGTRATTPTTFGRRALIASQVAVSLVLVFSAGLLVRNLAAIRSIDPGYEPTGVRSTRLEFVFGQPREIDQVAYMRPLLDRISAHPGVTGAALSVSFPDTELRHVRALTPFQRSADGPGVSEVQGFADWISPGYFSTLGVRMLQGREFTWLEPRGQPVGIINRALASRLFPNGNAVGTGLRFAARNLDVTIVGVAENSSPGDVRIGELPTLFLPILTEQRLMLSPSLILRTQNDSGLDQAVSAAIEPVGRHRVPRVRTIREEANRLHMRERLLTGLATAFAGLSLLVAGLGLYALLAHQVTERTRELGVRRALGATGMRVLSMVMREGMALVLIGVIVGLPFLVIANQAIRAVLFEAPVYDPVSAAVSILVLASVGLFACAWPGLRALRIGPAEALRHE
jgi:predicted permease